jgi:hypothetical protein
MTSNVQDVVRSLDSTTRREKLLAEARGTWRISTGEAGWLLVSAGFLYITATNPSATSALVFMVGSLIMWRVTRLDSRLDAIVKLLEREG